MMVCIDCQFTLFVLILLYILCKENNNYKRFQYEKQRRYTEGVD